MKVQTINHRLNQHHNSHLNQEKSGNGRKITESSIDKNKKNVQELIRLDSGDIKTCKDPKCSKKYPHQHLLNECIIHSFCDYSQLETEIIQENITPCPVPIDNNKGYLKSLKRKRKFFDDNKKLVITEQNVDTWYGIQASLDIANLPPYRPPNVNKIVYDNLKKYALKREDNLMMSPQTKNQSKKRQVIMSDSKSSISLKSSMLSGGKQRSSSQGQKLLSQIQQAQSFMQSPHKLIDSFQFQLFPRHKQIETFIDTLPQYLSEDEINSQNIIQQMRFYKKKQMLQIHSAEQINEENKKNKRKVQIIKQDNFEHHQLPNKYTQNRMNSSLNQLMSRTEIESTVSKLNQIPKGFKINPVIGSATLNPQSQIKGIERYNNSNDYVSKIDQQNNENQRVETQNSQHNRTFSTINNRSTASGMRRTNTNFNRDKNQKTLMKSINIEDLDQTMMIQSYGAVNDNQNKTTFMDLTKNFTNTLNSSGFNQNPKSATNTLRKRLGVFRMMSPRTKIQEARHKDFNSSINVNDKRVDFSSLLMSKFGGESTKFNSDYKNETSSSGKPNQSEFADINARDINKEIQRDQNTINNSILRGFSTIQNSPRVVQTSTPSNQNQDNLLNEELAQKVKFIKKDPQQFIKEKIQGKIKENFKNKKDRHIFTHHIEKEEIEPANFNYDFCNLSMEQIQPDNMKTKQQVFQDAEFWLTKGFQMQKTEGTEVALDYYKHGIRVNPWNFPCVYNLACVYSHLNQNYNARKWFNLAIKIAPNEADSYFGSAISSFKLRDYKSALKTLQARPDFSTPTFLNDYEFIYFKALCQKKLRNFTESEKEYKSLERQLKLEEGKKLIKYVFSIMILPLQTDKKLIEDYLDNYLEIQNQYNIDICIDNTLSQNLENLWQKGKWTNIQTACDVLRPLKFFQNIPLDDLETIIPKTTLRQVKKGDLIFVEDRIIIVLNGRLILRLHESTALNHKIVGQYSQGSVLGYAAGDKGLSCDSNSWIICGSKEAYILEVDEKIYQKMIVALKKQEKEIRLLVLQNVQLFKYLYPLTQNRIVYELGYVKKFEKGEILLTHHPRSALNLDWVDYYKDFNQNKLQKEIEKNLNGSNANIVIGKTMSPSVYEGYMKALSRKKDNSELLTTIKKSQGFNNQIRKIMLKNMSDGFFDIIKKSSGRLSTQPENNKFFNSMSTFDSKIKYYIEKRPIIIILQGKCNIINNFDGYEVATLQRGDIIGDSDFLRQVSYDFFGDIIAEDNNVECLVIENPDLFINFPEKKQLVDAFQNRLDGIKYIIQTRYKLNYFDMHRY